MKKSNYLLPFMLIGGGIGVFASQSFTGFFFGIAAGVVIGYFILGLANCQDQTKDPEGPKTEDNERK